MPKPSAIDAYVAATVAFTDQLTELRRMVDAHFDLDPDAVNWADVGTIEHDIATLRKITDRHFGRGEYARAA